MAYSGWLLKIGNYIVDEERFIKAESYSPYANMQVLDPWTDANGYEHINAVDLKALKVEFETPAGLTNDDFKEFMDRIRENYVEGKARKCIVTAYIPEYDDYATQLCYISNFQPQIYGIYDGKIHYNSIRFAIIGGVAND